MSWIKEAKSRGQNKESKGKEKNIPDYLAERRAEQEIFERSKSELRASAIEVGPVFSDISSAGIEVRGPIEGMVVFEHGSGEYSLLGRSPMRVLGDKKVVDQESDTSFRYGITWYTPFCQFSLFVARNSSGGAKGYEICGYGIDTRYNKEPSQVVSFLRELGVTCGVYNEFRIRGSADKMVKKMKQIFAIWAKDWFSQNDDESGSGMLADFESAAVGMLGTAELED